MFSDTLNEVVGNTRLAQAGIAEEVAELQDRSGKDVAIGGAELAAEAIKSDWSTISSRFSTPCSSEEEGRSFRRSTEMLIWNSLRRGPSARASFTCTTNVRKAGPLPPKLREAYAS